MPEPGRGGGLAPAISDSRLSRECRRAVPDLLAEGELGLIVPSVGVSELAAALVRLAEPAERTAVARTGREEVIARFGSGRLVPDLVALYNELLAGHRTVSA